MALFFKDKFLYHNGTPFDWKTVKHMIRYVFLNLFIDSKSVFAEKRKRVFVMPSQNP